MAPRTIDLVLGQYPSKSAFARELGVSHQVAMRWLKAGWLPLKRAKQLAAKHSVPLRDLVSPALQELIDDEQFV